MRRQKRRMDVFAIPVAAQKRMAAMTLIQTFIMVSSRGEEHLWRAYYTFKKLGYKSSSGTSYRCFPSPQSSTGYVSKTHMEIGKISHDSECIPLRQLRSASWENTSSVSTSTSKGCIENTKADIITSTHKHQVRTILIRQYGYENLQSSAANIRTILDLVKVRTETAIIARGTKTHITTTSPVA